MEAWTVVAVFPAHGYHAVKGVQRRFGGMQVHTYKPALKEVRGKGLREEQLSSEDARMGVMVILVVAPSKPKR